MRIAGKVMSWLGGKRWRLRHWRLRMEEWLRFRLFRLRMRCLHWLGHVFDPQRYLMAEGDPLPLMVLAPFPANHRRPAYLVAPHKCGSMLLLGIGKRLARHNRVPFLDISSHLFYLGYRMQRPLRNLDKLCRLPGYMHGMFRTALYIDTIPDEADVIVLVRDPRDAIVSKYYSDTVSHPSPGRLYESVYAEAYVQKRQRLQALGLEGSAMEYADFYRQQFDAITRMIDAAPSGRRIALYRYEDVIFDKRRWMEDMVRFLGWTLEDGEMEELLRIFDLRPAQENPQHHVRRVTPGDHREKMSLATQQQVTRALHDILQRYGYL